ncbi:unnamed protein product [Prorocentrum cordatum]|uniref:Adenosylcobinamide-GDP ribazoletransferase n=1 Tax=Prorocentrum cordatum TaxID=2364126 RepID=A0ABN9PG45_9DINO|nr:unnamed protein product [Polarella glacialis]
MAPNNALGGPTAAGLREAAETQGVPAVRTGTRVSSPAPVASTRVATADGFGAGMVSSAEVAARGTGSAARTPLEEFEARPNNEVRCFFTGLMFVTRLPCPGWCDHHPGYLMRGMAWFPVLGCIVGLWASVWFDALALLWPPLAAAASTSAATLWLTGCFHEDGLCDTIDAFGGGWTKSQILRIMKDSRCGSYAVMAGSLWALAKVILLGYLGPSHWALAGSTGAGPALLVANCVARATAAPLIYCCEYVVDDEDAKGEYYNWFAESRRLLGLPRTAFAVVSATAVAFVLQPPGHAARAVAAGCGVTVAAGMYGNSVLGGVMGDFLGATICMAELAVYFALTANLEGLAAAGLAGWPAAAGPWFRLAALVAAPQAYAHLVRGPLAAMQGADC